MSHSDDADSRLAAAVGDSRVVAALDGAGDRLAGVGRGDRAAHLAAWTRRVVTDSYLYRWITAEPNSEVIVIDLRETFTVGPVIALLDQVVGWLDAAATSSETVAVVVSLSREFRAAPVRLVGTVVALGSATALLAGVVLGALGVVSTVALATLAIAGLAGTQVTVSWADLVDSRVGGFVIAALEPPPDESPIDTDDRDD